MVEDGRYITIKHLVQIQKAFDVGVLVVCDVAGRHVYHVLALLRKEGPYDSTIGGNVWPVSEERCVTSL
jgi:hypothetical protein